MKGFQNFEILVSEFFRSNYFHGVFVNKKIPKNNLKNPEKIILKIKLSF